MKETLCNAPTRETRPDHNTDNYVPPTPAAVGNLSPPAKHVALKMQETGPTVAYNFSVLNITFHLHYSVVTFSALSSKDLEIKKNNFTDIFLLFFL